MSTLKWNDSHWERSTRNMHLLLTEDMYLLAKISFLLDEGKWHIHLFKKYLETYFSSEIKANQSERAKKFSIMILGEGMIANPNWQDYSKTTFHLHDRLDGELLVMLNFETESKKWHSKILRREFKTTLGVGIGAEMTDEVKEFTKKMVNAEPYEYSKILGNLEALANKKRISKP